MRLAVFLLAALQLGFLVLFATGSGELDPADYATDRSYITVIGIAMGVLLTPALILAANRKSLGIALCLVLLPPILVGLFRLLSAA
ncbi:MAG: hypothetical protein OIF48_07795 [Silicimonas sp.]|nr:hypothetical protein [Silicimonas sp.]